MITVGIVANIYNEANALPGWLEMATSFADHVSVYHAGPGGKESDDGTIEILEKWKIPVHRGKIDEGFGIVRTAAIRSSPCDWVILLDADERFHQFAPVLSCDGPDTPGDEEGRIIQEYDSMHRGSGVPSNWENVGKLGSGLSVGVGEVYNQGAWLRSLMEDPAYDAIDTIRRHWHDFTWELPTQNWFTRPDFQRRIVRNLAHLNFNANTRMHETLMGARNPYRPNHTHGPFFDHYHLWFKRMEPAQRAFDLKVYDSLHFGQPMPEA
jgi:glycosyltransferase involved in cell wall biosynthesis